MILASVLGWLWTPGEAEWLTRCALALVFGLGAWVINAALVYRSGYLQGGYVLGWLWVLTTLTLTNTHLSWGLILGAGVAVIWLARVFLATHWYLHDLTWLGIVSAMWLWWDPATVIFIPMSWVLWPSIGAMRSRHVLWLFIGQLIALALTWSADILTELIRGDSLVDASVWLDWWWETPDWQIFNHWLIVPLLMLAMYQTPRALTYAKKAKSKAIALSWAAIFIAWLGYSFGPGDQDIYMGVMAVVALPQIANVQRYSLRPRLRSFLTLLWLMGLIAIRWWMVWA